MSNPNATPEAPASKPSGRQSRHRGRWPTIIVLIIALIATGITRQITSARRDVGRKLGQQPNASAAGLSRMNSFALTLLLGGLRGPLVMILWTSSENQKTDKNLEDFDTKVEWIRLLQPEFDTVHIFQIWNKAYNISVQMASLANKYLTIIDAIDYAHKVDHERPDDINIIYQIGSVFGDKLGDSAEKLYYERRVRHDSLPHASRQKLAANDPGYRRLELDPVLDEHGNILPQFLKSSGVHLVDPNIPTDIYDGSELPFLKRFEPYPYGVAPYGFAYNYRKRAQLLQRLASQRHAQLSDLVIDSRPALDLKRWGEMEWEHGRRLELQAFKKTIPAERTDMEEPTADLAIDSPLDADQKALLKETIFSYDLAARVWVASDAEYVEHLRRYKTNLDTYESHRDELAAERELVVADHDYLVAMLTAPADRPALLTSAAKQYRKAIVRYALIILRYYVSDTAAARVFPPGVTRANLYSTLAAHIDDLKPPQIMQILNATLQAMHDENPHPVDEVAEYLGYITRANARLAHLPQ